ncbi:hypothetical protein SLS62_000995 [Diatrype stigma]|uniref:C2H2-type domain-containing protein n=1 Tax=Diatrype stigma TaxID=117547 RepID=A0AAN9YWI0_9PEZI
MTLATPYLQYTGYHDAKSYPNVAEAQGKLVLPIDIYNHDLDFLSYADNFYTFDSDLSSNNSSAPSPLGSPMEHADHLNLMMPSPYPVWDETNEPMSNTNSNESQATSTMTAKGEGKAQCWEHGCNGRVFSTWSNLKRHQKEKSGNAKKVLCPQCGGEFTRVTARDTHLAKGSCNRIRRYSNGRQRPSRVALLEMLLQQPSRGGSAV